jgi:hypothetical protein
MTNYVITGSVGTYGVPTDFTPNGTPVVGVDTITIGAGKELRIAGSGITTVCAYTIGGSSGPTYAKITVLSGGTLKHGATPTINDWTEYELQGNATVDCNGYDFLPNVSDASGVRFKLYATGTAFGAAKTIIKSSAAMCKFGGSTDPIGIYLDLNNFEINNLNWRAGGSYYNGNHLRLQYGLIKNYGAFSISGYQADSSDVILKNLEFRGCSAPAETNLGTVIADLGFHPTGDENGGDVTGARTFENVVFDATDTPGSQVKVKIFWLRGFIPNNLMFLDCQPYDQSGNETWDSIFVKVRNEGNAAFGVLSADNLVVVSNNDNPKHFSGSGTWNAPVVECKWLGGVSADAGDLWVIGNSDPLVLNFPLLIDEFGSGMVNALSADRGANVTLNHATYIADVQHPQNGFFRNEGGGRYTGVVGVTNNINYIRSNPTNAAVIYGFNLGENTANDQLTTHGYNCWVNYPSQLNSSIYHAVNSATKTLGQTDWGGGDIFTDPEFIQDSRGIMSWGAMNGAATYSDSIQALAKGVNGYDKASGIFNSGAIIEDTVEVYYEYVRNGFAPTALAYINNDSTGTRTRGAVEWTAAPSSALGVTSSEITSSSLTSRSVTQRN